MAVVQMYPYASHQELLAACVMKTTGPVIELGCGFYSTLMLHQMCTQAGRPLVTVESDAEWAKQFLYMQNGLHNFYIVKDFADLRIIDTVAWDVAFVDQVPAARRAVDVMRLAEKTKFIVVHDTDQESDFDYHIRETLGKFKYQLDTKRFPPMTTVVSNLTPMDGLIL